MEKDNVGNSDNLKNKEARIKSASNEEPKTPGSTTMTEVSTVS